MRKVTLEIGKLVTNPNILRPGHVVAIPLPGIGYGYGRVHRNATLAIFVLHSVDLLPVKNVVIHPIAVFTRFGCTKVQKADWIFLGRVPFDNEDEAWPPAAYAESLGEPKVYTLLHRNTWKEVPQNQITGLDLAVFRHPDAIRKLVTELVPDSDPMIWRLVGKEWRRGNRGQFSKK